MTTVNISRGLKEELQRLFSFDRIKQRYSSMQKFVEEAIREKMRREIELLKIEDELLRKNK